MGLYDRSRPHLHPAACSFPEALFFDLKRGLLLAA